MMTTGSGGGVAWCTACEMAVHCQSPGLLCPNCSSMCVPYQSMPIMPQIPMSMGMSMQPGMYVCLYCRRLLLLLTMPVLWYRNNAFITGRPSYGYDEEDIYSSSTTTMTPSSTTATPTTASSGRKKRRKKDPDDDDDYNASGDDSDASDDYRRPSSSKKKKAAAAAAASSGGAGGGAGRGRPRGRPPTSGRESPDWTRPGKGGRVNWAHDEVRYYHVRLPIIHFISFHFIS
jgi:hypothetical protein